LSKKLANIWF